MGLTRWQALRRWLFRLCQSRAGQCLEQQPKPPQNP
jgi:hypothetical protein